MEIEKVGKQNKEQAILLAAEQEFLAKGYDGARTTSIARAAGVTHAMLHYYFRSKEHLFERILTAKIELMAASLVAALGDPSLPIHQRLSQGISRHFDFLVANPALPQFIIHEVLPHSERLQVLQANVQRIALPLYEQLQRDVDAAAERGEIERVDVLMLMLDMFSLNIMPFLSYPILASLMAGTFDLARFLEARKEESIQTILRRIQKQQ